MLARRIGLGVAALGVALGLLVGFGGAALAVDVDLGIKTANATNLSQLTYEVGAARVTIDGAAAQIGVTLDLDGLVAGTKLLRTSFGDFEFAVDASGSLTVPAGVPLTVSGSMLTIQNTVDLPDLAVRFRNATSLQLVRLQPILLRVYRPAGFPNAANACAAVTLVGASANAPVGIPLLGLVPGARIRLDNNLGAAVEFDVSGTGAVLQAPTSGVTITTESTAPDVVILENPIDLPGFGIRTSHPTTFAALLYYVDDIYGPAYYTPTSTSTGGVTTAPHITTRAGATAHTDTATFAMTGLVPGQRVRLVSTWGNEYLRATAAGALERVTTNLPATLVGNVIIVSNDITIQNFRIRSENTVNANQDVRVSPGIYPNTGWWTTPGTYPLTMGQQFPSGLSFPLEGVTPGLGLRCSSGVGRCHFRVKLDSSGLELHVPYPNRETDGVISVGPTGDVTLTMLNSREMWVKIYGAGPAPASRPTLRYTLGLDVGGSALDDSPRDGYPADFEDGEILHVKYVGPQTRMAAGVVAYPPAGSTAAVVSGRVWFTLRPDGTAVFYDGHNYPEPATVTPTLGAVPLVLDGVSTTLYVEFVDPPNTAPTVTIGEGDNLTILSSAQSTTTLTASVHDDDVGDTLLCSWFVEDVLVAGPAVPVGGATTLDLDGLANLGPGTHDVRVEVSDGINTATDELVLTVDNAPPDVAVGGGGVYELAGGVDGDITLTAQVADYDGDELTYAWTTAGGIILVSGTVATSAGGAPVAVPPWNVPSTGLGTGTHVLTLTVEDEDNNVVSASVEAEVTDTTAPTLKPVSDRYLLWPPNHAMVEVVIDANAWDLARIATLDVEVTSSEPPEFDGTGSFLPDHEIVSVNRLTGEITLELRAERSGRGDGRVYTVTITATDASGLSSTAQVEVVCPHDKKK